ncbi:STYKc [Aspergillus sclerotialis]|uniref:STYKc n=1 Tax=Aspergillus sclerotialis TaxID=2070753 RepID=A0A3A2ZDU9_9EURO|nr:STYKc [Aspergillus sclerotialis]
MSEAGTSANSSVRSDSLSSEYLRTGSPTPSSNASDILIDGPKQGDSLIEYEPIPPPPCHPNSFIWTCPNYETFVPIDSRDSSCVFKINDERVLKFPRSAAAGRVDVNTIQNEDQIYKRLGSHEGIIGFFETIDGVIELAFANQGNLREYIKEKPMPPEPVRREWIQSLADTFAYVHSRRVSVVDIDCRNILVHNGSLKLSSFGCSVLLPIDADMERFYVCMKESSPEGELPFMVQSTVATELFHLGCAFYSIAAWDVFNTNYDHDYPPALEGLPDTHGVFGEEVIIRCWTGRYPNMAALKEDVQRI